MRPVSLFFVGLIVVIMGGGCERFAIVPMERFKESRQIWGTDVALDICYSPQQESTVKVVVEKIMVKVGERIDQIRRDLDLLNGASSGEATVGPDVYGLLQRAWAYGDMTGGMFDVTAAPLQDLWQKKLASNSAPSHVEIQKVLSRVAYSQLEFGENGKIKFGIPGMKVTVDNLLDGFIVEALAQALREHKFRNFLIQSAYVYSAEGHDCSGTKWRLRIPAPQDAMQTLEEVEVSNAVVAIVLGQGAASEVAGIRYPRRVSPLTGKPPFNFSSVVVLGPDAEFAQALAAAVSLMDSRVGVSFIETLPGAWSSAVFEANDNGSFNRVAGKRYLKSWLAKSLKRD